MNMILLQVNQLCKYYGADLVLSNIKLEIQTRDRIALVGRNGAGKSTLLKIISGNLSYDSGEIMKPKEVKMGYLAQNTGLESIYLFGKKCLLSFLNLENMETKIKGLERQMSDPSVIENETKYEKFLKEYDIFKFNLKNRVAINMKQISALFYTD